MSQPELVSFDEMPENIHELLTKNDYTFALLHPGGFKKGLFMVIHLNENYPQWHNITLDPNDDQNILVYVKRGWVEKDFDEIFKVFSFAYVRCFAHVWKNKEKMYNIKPK